MSLTSSRARYTFALEWFQLSFEVVTLKCVCWFVGLLTRFNYLVQKIKFIIIEFFMGHKIYKVNSIRSNQIICCWSILALHTWQMEIWNYFISLHFYVKHILDIDSSFIEGWLSFHVKTKLYSRFTTMKYMNTSMLGEC